MMKIWLDPFKLKITWNQIFNKKKLKVSKKILKTNKQDFCFVYSDRNLVQNQIFMCFSYSPCMLISNNKHKISEIS